eukprot:gene9749-10746_t
MLKLLCLFAIVAYASAASWTNCNNNLPVTISLRSLPEPVSLKSGARIPVVADATVRSPAPCNVKLHVKLYKKIWFWIKMPCIKNVGSCSYDIDFGDVGISCPAQPGSINVAQTITVPSISVPSFLVSVIAVTGIQKREEKGRKRRGHHPIGLLCLSLADEI